MDARDMTDRELLLAVHTAVQDIKHDIYGNGQPGMLKEFETYKAKFDERTAPSTKSVLGLSGAATIFMVAAAEFLKGKLGG